MKKVLSFILVLALLFCPIVVADTATYSTLTNDQVDQLNRVGRNSAVLEARWVWLGDVLLELINGAFIISAAADSAATNKAASIAITTPADTTGTNSHYGIDISATIGNATGGTNTVRGINFGNVTGDAQVNVNAITIGTGTTLGTSNAFVVGSGWDAGIVSSSPVDFSGTQARLQVSTVAGLTACAAGNQGAIATVTDATGATDCTTGASSTVNLCYCNGSAWTNVA